LGVADLTAGRRRTKRTTTLARKFNDEAAPPANELARQMRDQQQNAKSAAIPDDPGSAPRTRARYGDED